ncbi:MAG TPA: hypothetical protein PKL70_00345 [Saprospiraceae bacterium]|nr:hypothetical protein [Saprospiraceae bacterium]
MKFPTGATGKYLPYLALYFMLLLAHGYQYGSGDQSDFMPYALHLRNPDLYPGDFYISCLKEHFNERWLIARILSLIPPAGWPVLFMIIHFLASVLLFNGLLKFSAHFLSRAWMQWLLLSVLLIVLYPVHLGGNELYYNMVCPSLLSKAAGIWCLWFCFRQDDLKAALCAVLATWLHPVAGFQVFILGTAFLPAVKWGRYCIITLTAVAPYLFILLKNLTGPSQILPEVMALRNAHHFYPAYFGLKNAIILLPIFFAGTALAYRKDRRIFRLGIWVLLGCGVYLCTLPANPDLAIKSQWFKSTIWLEFFSLLMIGTWLSDLTLLRDVLKRLGSPFLMLVYLIVLVVALYRARLANWYFPWSAPNESIRTALEAKSVSQPGDLFIVPAGFTSFKFFAERPCWLDWKAIPHRSDCLEEWAGRVEKAYGLTTGYQGNLQEIDRISNARLASLDQASKEMLKAAGVKYVLFRPEGKTDYRMIKL